ncbi:flagellin [Magnetovibrio sp.]|uniref:flagellin n=1 Tax=Magnetovibrio sp. TaxID=2024836 RepID=UPI002F94BAB1
MPTITTNTSANTALRYLNINSAEQNDNLAKIASGSRITRASDDAAGLAIGTALQTDVATLKQASTNTSHGVSVLSTADGGMASINDILQRMKVLTTQSVSGTNSATELGFIQSELDALVSEVNDIAAATSFNGQSLLDGTTSYATGVAFMAGTSATDVLTVTINAVDANTLGLSTAGVTNLDVVTDAASRTAALTAIDTAIDSLSTARAATGAQMSRFEYRSDMLATSTENIDAAQSAIMDTDIAAEQAELSSNEVKTDAAISALSKANELPMKLLDLLR